MRNAILLHGRTLKDEYYSDEYPSASNSHWFAWAQKQLFMRDIIAHTPEVPQSWNPQYSLWRKEFERYDITPETLLVGHSCGGGFLLRWLSEHTHITVDKVILVAPWIDPDNELSTGFFDFTLDNKLADRADKISLFASTNDHLRIRKSVDIIRNTIPGIHYHEFHNYGHFCYSDLKTDAFPELIAELL